GVAAVRDLGEEAAGQFGELGPHPGVEFRPELAERGVQLLVVAELPFERPQRIAPLLVIRLGPEHGVQRLLRGLEEPAHLRHAQPGRSGLPALAEPIRAPVQLQQLCPLLFRLPVPGDVVPRRVPGKLLPQPREPRLLLLPLGPERGPLMDRLFAARPLPLPVRDGPRQLLPTRLRRGHFRWRRFELLATLLQPLPVLDQTVPLVLQVREYPLVLLPQRTPARGADPVRPGLPELLELLLQLLRPVPVRLE